MNRPAPSEQVASELAAGRRLLALFPPAYGSPEWSALPDGHPDKARSVIDAAEAWRRHCSADEVAERIRAELDAIDLAAGDRLKELSADIAEAGADRWHLIANGPTYVEMQRRRYPWLFDPHYPTGHPGGPVAWEPADQEESAA